MSSLFIPFYRFAIILSIVKIHFCMEMDTSEICVDRPKIGGFPIYVAVGQLQFVNSPSPQSDVGWSL